MTLVLGIDPGAHGALVVWDDVQRDIVYCEDMPTWEMVIGKSRRTRVDAVGLDETFDFLKNMLNVQLVVIEGVGGRPKQSASSGFVFGYSAGLLYMGCVHYRLPVEVIPPQTWKKALGVRGKKQLGKEKENKAELTGKDVDGEIIKKADDLFPEHRHLWRTKRGAYRVDRAEAAMMARFGADHLLRIHDQQKISDPEWKLAYRNADIGAV